jgi:ADP-ribose pyrophosphatase YjhB (NUDIX family)
MALPVALRRTSLRLAYLILRVYWFVFRPTGTGVKCVLTEGDRLLLVMHTYGPRRWGLPGGGVRRGEPPAACATREMKEELGLTITEWTDLGTISGRSHHKTETLYCFRAELRDPQLTVDHAEIETTHWFDRDALPSGLGEYAEVIMTKLAP